MYRTTTAIEATMQLLAAWFPAYFTRIRLPELSVEGRSIHALRMRAGGGDERRGVLFVGGTHARELMNPDAILELAIDLLVSHTGASDVVYGGRVWSAETIRLIVESLDLWFFPCINPDGRHYVMTTDDMWRKNRRDNPGTSCDGVDLNRNLDVLWGVIEGQVSCSPCSDVFCGPSAFSEPETRNVKYLLDTRRIGCFVDVHSYSELILYPWGHAPTQTTDPSKRFTSLPTGTCSGIAEEGYAEYMTPRDRQRYQTVAQRIVDAIQPVRGRTYTPQTGYQLYATTGTHGDYVYSRHIANPSLQKTYSFTFETGPWTGNGADSFHPADPDPIKLDAKSGMIALAQQCICAIDLIGSQLLGGQAEADGLRRVRDEALATTEAGRGWIDLFDSVHGEVFEALLADKSMTREGASLIKRVASLLAEDKPVTKKDLSSANVFLAKVGSKCGQAQASRSVDLVTKELSKLDGYRASAIVEHFMSHPPRAQVGTPKPKGKKKPTRSQRRR